MAAGKFACLDGNEAAARVAYKLSEVIAIYPITPSSPMGEFSDSWAAASKENLWGAVPEVVEMQSEGGAAGALHGALQRGTLATTFTSSQGLLLMFPNMFKIAGELTPAVIHVAARTIATHALSIFGDHSDVMAARSTGFAMLSGASLQEAHDFALISHDATLRARVPFLHFFDGFRTSHEVGKIEVLPDEVVKAMVSEETITAFRGRRLTPDAPLLRGTAQNPDVFFQAREACNPYHDAVPGIVQDSMDRFAKLTGRKYSLVEYVGAPDAERVVVLMGSGIGAATEAVNAMVAKGEKVGFLKVRLYRPFPSEALLAAMPKTVKSVAVLDRCKEPGASGEPLYHDVITTFAERGGAMPRIIGGRYGLSSKEFTPAMVKGIFDELAKPAPKKHFTVGIVDDVTHLSLPWDRALSTETASVRAVLYGLGSDGTVSSAKSSVKIIGENTDLDAQGYFVYDSKKSGSVTASHLRFGKQQITSTYLIEKASIVACHQFPFLERVDMLKVADEGAIFLLNSPYDRDEVWDHLPEEVQDDILAKRIDLWVIDALKVAREAGMGNRINTVMQPCFFKLSNVLPEEEAIGEIKRFIEKSYGKRGREVVEKNFAAVDMALGALHRARIGKPKSATHKRLPPVVKGGSDFVERILGRIIAGEGDLLPVSALPADGTFPTATARFEKRGLATEIPIWDKDLCIDCGKCANVCPHAAIRTKVFEPSRLADAPAGFVSKVYKSKDLPGMNFAVQVSPDDCTGCGVCVETCPAKSKTVEGHKSIDMLPYAEHVEKERANWAFFEQLPELDPATLPANTVKEVQLRQPLFEFSGACAGCGETPYVKLLSQLFGERMVVANATGCSSIYGGNLPTTPWTQNAAGRGPAWANSLFEDNAEFGLGMRVAAEQLNGEAKRLLQGVSGKVGDELVKAILEADQKTEAGVKEQRIRVTELKAKLSAMNGSAGLLEKRLLSVADELVKKSVWIVGGDGWAYDIGFGGLDHVLASGRNVNILVMDTEVYSNTGGQASKATPRASVAKFASAGKLTPKKDLGMIAMSYGNVYVAQIAMGANDTHALKVFQEADAWDGPSIVIAYSTCIAHGIDMKYSMGHQKDAVAAGYWPLYRFNPAEANPFKLDSKKPTITFDQFARSENRYAQLVRSDPNQAQALFQLAQADMDARWRYYEQLAGVGRTAPKDGREATLNVLRTPRAEAEE